MNANGEILWENPPEPVARGNPHAVRRSKWVPLLTPLMDRPTEWARVDIRPTGKRAGAMAGALRKGKSVIIPPGRWEFTSRTQPDGTGAIYARYLGPELAGETS